MKIKKYLMKDKNLCLKKPRTGALNRQFLRVRPNFWFGTSYQYVFQGYRIIFGYASIPINLNFSA